jgi:hypothetical protein
VPVQDHAGDPGLGGDIVETGGGEPGLRERTSCRLEDLLPPPGAGQAVDRCRLFLDLIVDGTPPPLVYAIVYN